MVFHAINFLTIHPNWNLKLVKLKILILSERLDVRVNVGNNNVYQIRKYDIFFYSKIL